MIFFVPQLFLIGLWTMGKIGTYRLPFLGLAFGAACTKPLRDPASARNCEILKSWCVISIADMLPAPRINDICIESQLWRFGNPPTSQVLRRLVIVA